MRVLVTDDSAMARRLLKQALLTIDGVTEVDVASHGRIALGKLAQSSFDLLLLDLEMPELDGIETLREIKNAGLVIPILIFASQTQSGAQKSLEALRLGAWDVIAKPVSESFSPDQLVNVIADAIRPKVKELVSSSKRHSKVPVISSAVQRSAPSVGLHTNASAKTWARIDIDLFRPTVIVIASSTGGPKALDTVFSLLKSPPRIPIFLVQHMPPLFTKSLAENIAKQTGVDASEAEQDSEVVPGTIRIAPGGYHMSLKRKQEKICLHLDQDVPIHYVRPAADRLFISAAEIYGRGCLGIVLTGMGEDGRDGALAIKRAGGAVMIQDEASSVVWGMPGSVFHQDAYDEIGDLMKIAQQLHNLAR